jgi:hypothetical protein
MQSPVPARGGSEIRLSKGINLEAAERRGDFRCQLIDSESPNLKLPRAPRQKGDRCSSDFSDLEESAEVALIVTLEKNDACTLSFPEVSALPLAGHPLFVLRPPSLLAG